MARRALLLIVVVVLSTLSFLSPASAGRLPPSPTEGVDLINGPPENPANRYGWYGNRVAIPDYIVFGCENRTGDPTLKIRGYRWPRRTASGIYQIVAGTWNWYAGYREAYMAPPYLQHQKAALIWNHGKGRKAWRSCL